MVGEIPFGFFTLMISLQADGSEVDYEAFEKLVDSQIEAGLDGLVPVSTH